MQPGDDLGIGPAVTARLASVISRIDGVDSERLDAPDWLWDRIAASMAAEPAGGPPGSGSVVEYSIDADDCVMDVDRDWAAFARDNGAPELVELQPARTLWSYFDGDEVRDLWRVLVERVRANQAPARVPLRCDAPHMRRWFEMTLTPEPNGVVRFRSALVFEEERDSVSFLGPQTERDAEASPVAVCSWCGHGHNGDRWVEIEDLVGELRLLEAQMPSISYGICPACRDLMSADLLESAERRDVRG